MKTPCKCHACVALRLIQVEFNPATYSKLDSLTVLQNLTVASQRLAVPMQVVQHLVTFHLANELTSVPAPMKNKVELLAVIINNFTNYTATEKSVTSFLKQIEEDILGESFQATINRATMKPNAAPPAPMPPNVPPTTVQEHQSRLDADLNEILTAKGVDPQPQTQAQPAQTFDPLKVCNCSVCQANEADVTQTRPEELVLIFPNNVMTVAALIKTVERVYNQYPHFRPQA